MDQTLLQSGRVGPRFGQGIAIARGAGETEQLIWRSIRYSGVARCFMHPEPGFRTCASKLIRKESPASARWVVLH